MQGQSCVAERSGVYARNSNVNCHRLHVQAVEGCAVAVSPEIFIRLRRSVAADDIELGFGSAQSCKQIMQKLEQPWIIMTDRAVSMVSQEVIKTIQSAGHDLKASPINDVQPLVGVLIKEL
jgi:phosphopantetheine adenylyltransferase